MMQDTERISEWRSSKTALSEQDALSLLQEFAEQKRKEREKDPEVKRVKNKYSLKAPNYPSPSNVLHTGRQLPRTPGPGVLPLLPSQKYEPRTDEDEESFSSYAVKNTDNMVPSGCNLARTTANVLKEIQVNVKGGESLKSTNKGERDENSSVICDTAGGETTRSKHNDKNCAISRVSEVMPDLEKLSSGGAMMTAEKMMQDTERRLSEWRSSKTALSEQDALSLLQEFAEQKRKEREKDPEVKRVKNKYRLKAPNYPSPGNVLHTGRQLPRTPGPGVLPLLPSQKYEPRTDEDEESFSLYAVKTTDNMVPCGRQLARTPTAENVLRETRVKAKEGKTFIFTNKSEQDGNGSGIGDAAEEEIMSKCNDENGGRSTVSKVMPDPENLSPGGYMMTVEKELIDEDFEACSEAEVQNNRRISEMPVQGLHQMRISGVLKKMGGYECRNEDLEFLRHMENQEKAKVLKRELLNLRKELATTNQEKELVFAKKEKIEDDIEKMKLSFGRTVQLGRALLSRAQDPTSVGHLCPEDVLKQLNSVTIQNGLQQARLQLVAAEKELARRQQEVANRTSLSENQKRSLTLKVESSEQHVTEVQYKIRQLKEEAITLKTQITRAEENKSELQARVQKKRQQITYCLNHVKQNSEMSEDEREKMNRRLQRILHRKDNYLERERILQRLKEDLK